MTSRNDRARLSDNERTGLTGAFLGNILARTGDDDEPNEDADAKTEESDANSGESDWYPYDDPAFDNASFEDEEACLAAEELGLGDDGGMEGARGSVWGFRLIP